MNLMRFAVAVTVAALASASLGWAQNGNPTASTKETGAASGHSMGAEQTYVAAERDFKANFVKHWQVAKEFTLAVAEAMPAEGYGFKPNPKEAAFGQLMIHIAAQNSDSCAAAAGTKLLAELDSSAEAWPPAVFDKQTAIKLLTIAFDKCAHDIDAMPPEQWNKEVHKVQGQPVLASEALWYTFTHMAHHRGQAEVYLRIKNIKPPHWRF